MADPPDRTPQHATTRAPDELLATKLHLPRPPRGFVARPRLVDRLDDGLARELTLICAPAGFGKTSLLADWSQRNERRVGWLSLDAGDNDPVRFWRHASPRWIGRGQASPSALRHCSVRRHRRRSRRWPRQWSTSWPPKMAARCWFSMTTT